MHKTSTTFPSKVDTREFFSDASLKEQDLLEAHHSLVKQGQLKEASQYLYDNVEAADRNVSYDGAYIWNMMDSRLVAIEDYVVSHPTTKVVPYYSDNEPLYADQFVGMIWI